MDISSLQDWYLDSCRRHKVPPSSTVLSWFSKAKVQKSCQEKCKIVVLLNQLKDDDILPLIDVFPEIDSSDIDAVDIFHHESTSFLNEEYILSLMNAIKLKLQVIDLTNASTKKDFLWDLCHVGLPCHVLNLRSSHIQKLNMVGRFMRLHTLNLDFCTSLTTLQKDCFSCMPKLMRLSMCETRVANLWTTTAVLAKLPSLLELRFQNCLCCKDTGPCRASSSEKGKLENESPRSNVINIRSYNEELSVVTGCDTLQASSAGETIMALLSLQESVRVPEVQRATDDTSEVDEVKLSGYLQNLLEASTSSLPNLYEQTQPQNEIQDNDEHPLYVQKQALTNVTGILNKDTWHHPSPICFERHYREYMVASLPSLEVLDNLPIKKMERETSKTICSEYYEYLPYKYNHRESVVNILQKREMGTSVTYCQNSSKLKQPYSCGKSQYFFSRSLSAAKFGSSTWPFFHPVSSFSHISKEENKRLRPRQFEYHPSNSSLMAFGTLDGEIVVINHETGNIVGYNSSTGMMNSILGLCWLKKYPSKIVSGSDNGCLKLFDVNQMPAKLGDTCCGSDAVSFEDFEQLTSVHVNSTDDKFLASGYSKGVALYDISSGRRLQVFTNMHQEPINVAKFAHHSPFMFATSSFDKDVKMWDLRERPERPCYTASSSRGNVMVCFSPDDLYLLVSAIDNEVKQLLAVDGRLHMNFNITSTGSAHNYTRSYYMNGRDYIISGSCDEHVVRICCAQTGRRLRDVYIEGMESGNSIFVQSLRGDPFRHFNFSMLTACTRPTSKQEIVKVNLLASSHYADECCHGQDIHPYCGRGG
ncbi:Transducin family protein / WD-40 repeat family protein isoform 1 [Theobroma cacao]|uniref:Transducin family protein / WD-40 repeat family protein isoform 1 n=1 Tax=Theobroma cacao TaxID=3641 RepID=A0A061DHE2_THECC|nr:Transducin family protein / WD-40 repeat family protein isoform 1 [Theobroma cacao]